MAKNTTTNKNTANKSAPKASALDWNAEAGKVVQAAKEKGGSRGDLLGKIGSLLTAQTPQAEFLRTRCGEAGAQAIIEQPRNVLAKLPKLATCITAGTQWCSLAGLEPSGVRKEDASVVVALNALGAGNDRQKNVIAEAMKRYTGGANAQMGASLEALTFAGIVERAPGSARNASYRIVDKAKADALMPTS